MNLTLYIYTYTADPQNEDLWRITRLLEIDMFSDEISAVRVSGEIEGDEVTHIDSGGLTTVWWFDSHSKCS